MTLLPYWDRHVDLDMDLWAPYGLDFFPVSVNALHSEALHRIAADAFQLDSEFLCLRSFKSGQVGPLMRGGLLDPGRAGIDLGFLMVFGYSKTMEALAHLVAQASRGLKAGLTLCGFWDRSILVDESKVIALASENPLFDEESFFSLFGEILHKACEGMSDTAFFAERFGYRRFGIAYDTDDVTDLRIIQMLFDFEFDETRRIVGPAPELPFPPLMSH